MTPALADVRNLISPARLAAARDAFWRFAGTERAPLALYALYTGLLFLIFVAVTFPHDQVLHGVLARAAGPGLAVEVRDVGLGWTLGYRIGELRLVPRRDPKPAPLLTATAVRVAPSWFGLLRGRPYPLRLRADLYGGTLDATVDLRPEAFSVSAALDDVDARGYTGLAPVLEGRLEGALDGIVELRGDTRRPPTMSGEIDLRAVGFVLENGKIRGITVPNLHFPETHLAGSVKGGRLEFDDLTARGQEVSVTGDGTLTLMFPLIASVLNLDLTLHPAPDLPDPLRMALNLIPGEPRPNGDREVRVFGTLALPRVGAELPAPLSSAQVPLRFANGTVDSTSTM